MSHPGQCLTAQMLDAIATNRLDSAALEICEHHLDRCERCCHELESVTSDSALTDLVRSCLPDDDSDVRRFSCPQESADDQHDPIARLSSIFAPTDDPFRMGRLGGYEVCGVIGSGGMGIVLKVMDPALSRFVALKILSPGFWNDQTARRRFAQEAKAAASIVHDSVIEIYGVAETDGIPYFTMPYLRGDSLQQRINQQGALPLESVLQIAVQVADGLQAAHSQGLIHRDVKPANILLNEGASRARITDFGIARQQQEPHLTSTGQVAGTPQYMSPEQIRGETVDTRSDLFSLGSVMYAMSAGRPPFESDSSYHLLNQVVAADPPPLEAQNPAVPTWLAAIVSRLHAADPDQRYQSAGDLKEQLTQCLKALQQPHTASQPRKVARLDAQYRRRRYSSRRSLYGGILMIVFLVACTAAFMAYSETPVPEPTPEPVAESIVIPASTADAISVNGVVVDGKGKPIARTTVLAVQKTWPNNRYRQQMLTTKTNDKGEFRFDDFSQPGSQYAFLLSVVSPDHLLSSEYRLVRNGAQQKPVKLVARSMKPITLKFVDTSGNPVPGVSVLPSKRTEKNRTEHLTYGLHHIHDFSLKTDDQGQLKLSAWKIGEAAEIFYMIKGAPQEFKFKVPRDRVVQVTVKMPVATAPIDIKGQVVDSHGQPVPDIDVLAIRKTWPNMRYRQEALSILTDDQGHFAFDDFAPGGAQYAALLTVVTDGYAMTSEYQLLTDGAQCPPSRLQLEPAEPVTFTMTNTAGCPLSDVDVAPSMRNCGRHQQLNYSMHRAATAQTSDDSGQLTLTAWIPGDTGAVHYWYKDNAGGLEFTVGEDLLVALTVPD